MKHWVVCPGGVLKQVKAEHTLCVSEISPVEDVDPKSQSSSTNHSKMECTSERTDTGVRPLTVFTCGKSFALTCTLVRLERTHTGVKAYTCDTCGQSFAQSSTLVRHENTHTHRCETTQL